MRLALLFSAALCVLHASGAELKVVARLDLPPAGLAITANGRKFVSIDQYFEPPERIGEITGESTFRTFGVDGADAVLGMRSDINGLIWMLDNGRRSNRRPKIVAWSSVTGVVACTIDLPSPATIDTSFVRDLAIDLEHHSIYIADSAAGSDAALIVVNLNTLAARRVLNGAQSVVPEDIDLIVEGKPVTSGSSAGEGAKFRQGVSSVALDADCEWLYFAALNSKSLYRVRTRDLRDKFMEPAALAAAVERYSDKPLGEGLAVSADGKIYTTDLAANGIGVIGSDRKYQLLATDPKLRWPDCIAIDSKGTVSVVATQLDLSPKFNGGKDGSQKPYSVFELVP